MGDLQLLMGTIFAKIYDNSSEKAWWKWAFQLSANESFDKVSRLYSSGDRDHALIEVFRLLESHLRSVYFSYSGAMEKALDNVVEVYKKYQRADYYPDPRDFDPSVRKYIEEVNKQKVEKIINELKALTVINEGEMYLLHALRYYRNEVAHQLDQEVTEGVYEALFLSAIPLIKRLEEETVHAEKRLKQKVELDRKRNP